MVEGGRKGGRDGGDRKVGRKGRKDGAWGFGPTGGKAACNKNNNSAAASGSVYIYI